MLTRMYTADKGGFDNITYQVEAGKLEIHNCVGQPHPFEHLEQCAKGWWGDPGLKTGQPGAWAPPTEATWTKVGARVYEGLRSFMVAMKDEMTYEAEQGNAYMKADPTTTNQYEKPPVYFQSGDTQVTGMPAGRYGTIFTRIENWINLSMYFPGITVWTSQEEWDYQPDRKTLNGIWPAIEGMKILDKTPSWFSHTIHLEQTEKKRTLTGGAENQYRVWLKPHAPVSHPSVEFAMKFRIPANVNPESVPKYLLNDPMGVFGGPTDNIFESIFSILAGNVPSSVGGKSPS